MSQAALGSVWELAKAQWKAEEEDTGPIVQIRYEMNEETLGKNACTAAAGASETHDDLADLQDLAETYLLESQHLTKDFAVGPHDLHSKTNYAILNDKQSRSV